MVTAKVGAGIRDMKKEAAIDLRAILCSVVVVFGLIEFLHASSVLIVYVGGIVSLAAFSSIFPVTTRYTRIIAVLLCGSGLAALVFSAEISPVNIIKGFAEMTPLVTLMAAITLLAIPLVLGRYAELFQRFYSGKTRSYQPYLVSLLISYVLSFFASLGSIAPAYYLVSQNLNRIGINANSRFETTSISRGYGMVVIISPVTVSVGIALQYSGLTWTEMVVPVMFLSLAGLIMAFVLESSWRIPDEDKAPNEMQDEMQNKMQNKMQDNKAQDYKMRNKKTQGDTQNKTLPKTPQNGNKPTSNETEQEERAAALPARRYISFLLLFVGLISTIYILGNVLNFSSLNSISAGCFIITISWGLFSGRARTVLNHGAVFFARDISRLFDQILLFISAGFFTYSMEHSGGLAMLGSIIEGASGRVGTVVILAAVPLVIASLSVIGFHAFASGIIIAKTISLSPLYFNPLALAVALTCGMSISFMISPFSGLVLMLSSFTKQSPYNVGIKWNLKFAAVFWALTIIFIALANHFY